jgi:hypothetical protein
VVKLFGKEAAWNEVYKVFSANIFCGRITGCIIQRVQKEK